MLDRDYVFVEVASFEILFMTLEKKISYIGKHLFIWLVKERLEKLVSVDGTNTSNLRRQRNIFENTIFILRHFQLILSLFCFWETRSCLNSI